MLILLRPFCYQNKKNRQWIEITLESITIGSESSHRLTGLHAYSEIKDDLCHSVFFQINKIWVVDR